MTDNQIPMPPQPRLKDFARQVLLALGGPAAIDRERLENLVLRLEELYKDEEISTSVYGTLLITLGADHPHAHADCDMQSSGWIDDDPKTWKDTTGRTWHLGDAVYTDRYGGRWRWAGGYQADPDAQPLLSRTDYSECDVPLCRVWAVVGPLEVDRG